MIKRRDTEEGKRKRKVVEEMKRIEEKRNERRQEKG